MNYVKIYSNSSNSLEFVMFTNLLNFNWGHPCKWKMQILAFYKSWIEVFPSKTAFKAVYFGQQALVHFNKTSIIFTKDAFALQEVFLDFRNALWNGTSSSTVFILFCSVLSATWFLLSPASGTFFIPCWVDRLYGINLKSYYLHTRILVIEICTL